MSYKHGTKGKATRLVSRSNRHEVGVTYDCWWSATEDRWMVKDAKGVDAYYYQRRSPYWSFSEGTEETKEPMKPMKPVKPETIIRSGPSINGFTQGRAYRVDRMSECPHSKHVWVLHYVNDKGTHCTIRFVSMNGALKIPREWALTFPEPPTKTYSVNPCLEVSIRSLGSCILEIPEDELTYLTSETTETKETPMKTTIVDTVIINGTDIRDLDVSNLIGLLQAERASLASLRESLGTTVLKNIEKLTAPMINNIIRLERLIDDKAGEL